MTEIGTRITKIEWGRLEGRRPRSAGCNARLGTHGDRVAPPIARVTTDSGATGFGWTWIEEDQAGAFVGTGLPETVGGEGLGQPFRLLEYPLLDLLAKQRGRSVHTLISGKADGAPLRVPCYDTSLYMDDLHLSDDDEAAALIASEAAEGMARGHTAFKIKVGRGAMHMDLDAGTRRDIAVIRAVRETVGPDAQLMIDANNGYNLNLTKRVLAETADADVYWIEEAFHEDAQFYRALKEWMAAEGLATRIADGEGDASPRLLDWARDGLIDIIQYDIHRPGFSRWLELGPQLAEWGVGAAPHSYGEPFGNYAACHLAPTLSSFEAVEWDEATVRGLDASAYTIEDGFVTVPDLPGFGLALDEDIYTRAVRDDGWVVQ